MIDSIEIFAKIPSKNVDPIFGIQIYFFLNLNYIIIRHIL